MAADVKAVLFLLPTLRGGGSERVVVNLLRHLDRKRYRPSLAVVDARAAAYRHEVPADVDLVDLQCSRVRYSMLKIIRLIRHRRPDVVFSTLGHLNLALAMGRGLLPDGVRYVARESSIVSETVARYALPAAWRWAYRRFYGRFDRVICQARHMRNDLVETYRVPAGKVTVIPNPLDIARIRKLAAEPVATGMAREEAGQALVNLVAAGRLVEVKGFDLLIDALALRADPRLRLTVLGEGPLQAVLEQRARDRGVAWQLRFAGFHANPYPFFAQADAFVLSSRHEGLPNVILEALACGTPVVVTPARGGVGEILQGLDGCQLADDVSPQGLAAALARVERDRRMPADCVSTYEAGAVTRRYEQILHEVLQGTTIA